MFEKIMLLYSVLDSASVFTAAQCWKILKKFACLKETSVWLVCVGVIVFVGEETRCLCNHVYCALYVAWYRSTVQCVWEREEWAMTREQRMVYLFRLCFSCLCLESSSISCPVLLEWTHSYCFTCVECLLILLIPTHQLGAKLPKM